MKKTMTALLCAMTLLSVTVLSGCGSSKEPAAEPAAAAADVESTAKKESEDFQVALLIPGNAKDGGWSELAYDGLMKAEQELGVKVSYSENVGSADYEAMLSGYADQGYDMVIGHGTEFFDVASQVGPSYPDTQFAITSTYKNQEPNVCGLDPESYNEGFVTGICMAVMSEAQKIGFVNGFEASNAVDLAEGIKAGAEYARPGIETVVVYTGTYDDAVKAKEAAFSLIQQGCDVITQNCNAAGDGAVMACQEKGVTNIGLNNDENGKADAVQFSVVQGMTQGIFNMIKMGLEGELHGQLVGLGGVAGGGVYLAPFKDTVPVEKQEEITKYVEMMRDGTLNSEDYRK